MKNQFLLLLCLLPMLLLGQITSVDYVMKYNCETNQYDVFIEILGGSATTIPQRAQFNSQISLVVPTGETVTLHESYLPLQNNQLYDGTTPADWFLGIPVTAPSAQPENDFYGITPTLSPAAFYNDLETGDLVKVFSFTAGEMEQYDENVRFFRNNEDPGNDAPGMGGSSFANGFTLGGPTQLYNGNREESCITNVDDPLRAEANIYPNPFHNQLTIEIPEQTLGITIADSKGQSFYNTPIGNERILVLNSNDFPNGVYFVKFTNSDGSSYGRKVIKL